ncbi:MAG: GNAT family N-acetyltransferase [Actinomycetota bacterium]|nr:GNAT family N-acetyltransferase [Actinomycetota bacterium]
MTPTSLVEVEAGDWDDLLERLGCADVYYLRAYLETACLLEPGRPVLLHLPDDVVCALVLRDVPDTDYRDVTTPYGYGGPLAVGRDTPVDRFYEEYEAWCREHRVVTTFVRFHPVFANHRYAPESMHKELLGETIEWDLERHDDLLEGLHPKHRNKVRKARNAGLDVTVEEGPADLSEFVELYQGSMERVDASSFYFFPREYWQRLTEDFREHVVKVDARFGDELAASGLFLAAKPWLHYHLSGTTDRGRRAAAANLVVYEAGAWALRTGFKSFHLGGGLRSGKDSLYDFKVRFAPDGLREAWEGKLVHDAGAYRALTGTDSIELEGFFPAYRRSD